MSESLDDLARTHVTQPAVQAEDEFSPGLIVGGKYKIITLLGRGGIGSVYKVEQIFLAQQFALKTLNAQRASDQLIRRFQNEARAASSLSHPNLVKVIDFGLLDAEQPYLVMDLVDGETLSERLKTDGVFNLEQAVACFTQVCLGLSYAHEQGIIHRDIKPSNIMISGSLPFGAEGFVKVVDFGIAKLAYAEDGETQSLTTTGEIFGSPLYMSPEQCSGLAVDYRCDIYSLGCVLFEALVGTAPFVGQNALSTMMLHQSQRAPTLKEASLGKDFPPELEQVVSKMLSKAPSDRYESLGIVANDLAQISKGAPVLGVSSVVTKPDKVSEPLKMSRREFQVWLAVTAVSSACVSLTIGYFAMQAYQQKTEKVDVDASSIIKEQSVAEVKNTVPLVPESDPQLGRVLDQSDDTTEKQRFEKDFYASVGLIKQAGKDPAKLKTALAKYQVLSERASKNSNLSKRFSGALEWLIACCYIQTHRDSNAVKHLRSGFNLTEDPIVRADIARAFGVLADKQLRAGHAQNAFNYWFESANLFAEISRTPGLKSDQVMAARLEAGNTLVCCSALCHQYLNDFRKAIQLGKQSAELTAGSGDECHHANALLNLGAAQSRGSHFEDAEKTLQNAVDNFKRSKSLADDRLVNMGNCYHELYAVEMRLGKTDKARAYLLKAQNTLAIANPKSPQFKKIAESLLASVNSGIKSNGWQRAGN